jgi:hypothetical protein
VTSELGRLWEEAVMTDYKVISRYFPEGLMKTSEHLGIVEVLLEIPTSHLLNASPALPLGSTGSTLVNLLHEKEDLLRSHQSFSVAIFYGTRRFITVFTRSPPLSSILSQINSVHTTRSCFSN